MLSNLASYLGYSSAVAERTPAASVTAEVRVRDEEDDWVLVEQATERDRDGAQPSEADDETGVTRVTLAISTYPAALPGSSKNPSRSVSLDVSCPLQESWYLTPPPSFSSDGPVHMETSPLENMLIEHPSMSVYERTSAANASSPGEEEPSQRPPSPSRLSRKEKLKMSRNKTNAKFSKKVPKRVNEDGTSEPEKTLEAKEPKIKNLVESPRKSRRVPKVRCGEPFDGMHCAEEKEVPVVPPRKLYSEVLASKPEPSAIREPSPEPVPAPEEQEVPESEPAAPAESESVMSVEDAPEEEPREQQDEEEEEEEESAAERPRTVQRMVDPQQRQNFLTRSAQKMKNLVEEPSASETDRSGPLFRSNGRKKYIKMH
ncbi:UNVERIFIED_CONTAM: hypothetical protein PYX00_001200 [Menopon gallinae]|uniref:Uncharacterized protein n=1 Tax=Menopon gallinae TaxID=328185 RepID=A0AAW2ID59_9NEOP